MVTVRWLLLALLPAAVFAVVLRRTDPRREPRSLVALTFALGALGAAAALFVTQRAAARTGLDVRISAAGEAGALVFLFFVVAPIQEAAKVAAAWPAFLAKRVHLAYDGVVYAAASSLGFAAIENAVVLRAHPVGAIWIARAVLALPAHVFFACVWGYALARAKRSKGRVPIFPAAFIATIAGHGLYAHFVYGRGSGALIAVTPLLAVMGVVSFILGRDLRAREHAASPSPMARSGLSLLAQAPSLSAVRSALRRADEPIKVRWILFGALVTLGAMIVGLAGGVFAAHVFHIDLSTINEHELRTAAPALLLVMGLLGSFPTSGWLVARAAHVRTLLEPALATGLALLITLVALGLAAPFAVVFALAVSPIAWLLSCAGAWIATA